ncbi:MAG: hypothetical protein E7505_01910 [Ruminococcus sp.]|nr:hypothetical protein [Ruminococcus sp.]
MNKKFIAAMMAASSFATASLIFAVSNLRSLPELVHAQTSYDCDINKDGKVDVIDLNIIKRVILNDSSSEPVKPDVTTTPVVTNPPAVTTPPVVTTPPTQQVPENKNPGFSSEVLEAILTDSHRLGTELYASLEKIDETDPMMITRAETFCHKLANGLMNLTPDQIKYNHGIYMLDIIVSKAYSFDDDEAKKLYENYSKFNYDSYYELTNQRMKVDVKYIHNNPDAPKEFAHRAFIAINPVYIEGNNNIFLNKTMIFSENTSELEKFMSTGFEKNADTFLVDSLSYSDLETSSKTKDCLLNCQTAANKNNLSRTTEGLSKAASYIAKYKYAAADSIENKIYDFTSQVFDCWYLENALDGLQKSNIETIIDSIELTPDSLNIELNDDMQEFMSDKLMDKYILDYTPYSHTKLRYQNGKIIRNITFDDRTSDRSNLTKDTEESLRVAQKWLMSVDATGTTTYYSCIGSIKQKCRMAYGDIVEVTFDHTDSALTSEYISLILNYTDKSRMLYGTSGVSNTKKAYLLVQKTGVEAVHLTSKELSYTPSNSSWFNIFDDFFYTRGYKWYMYYLANKHKIVSASDKPDTEAYFSVDFTKGSAVDADPALLPQTIDSYYNQFRLKEEKWKVLSSGEIEFYNAQK